MTPDELQLAQSYCASMVKHYDDALQGVADSIVDFTECRRKWMDGLEAVQRYGEMPDALKAGFDKWLAKQKQEANF